MKRRNTIIILFSILAAVLIGLISLYCIRAGTLLNGHSEETIINSLSEDKENPIKISAIERYEDYLAILYKSPLDDDSYNDYAHFGLYKKSRHYKNHYELIGENYGNFCDVSLSEINEEEIEDLQETNITTPTNVKCFLYDIAREDTTCNIYEVDAQGNDVRKLDELEIPQTDFIMIKEYELLSPLHSLSCAGSSYDYERSFNENYEETNKEQLEMIQKLQEQAEEEYNDVPWIERIYHEIVNVLYRLWNNL